MLAITHMRVVSPIPLDAGDPSALLGCCLSAW